jgi:hypothetical protein
MPINLVYLRTYYNLTNRNNAVFSVRYSGKVFSLPRARKKWNSQRDKDRFSHRRKGIRCCATRIAFLLIKKDYFCVTQKSLLLGTTNY